jgi:uncharacterized protein (TIGR02444 family)
MPNSVSGFWTFSLQTYAQPEIASICLELQERFGADVNLVLFMLWAASRGRRLESREIEKIAELVKDWREQVVIPLRLSRRALKSPPREWPAQETEALRQRIKADELEAERLQQNAMSLFLAVGQAGQPDSPLAAAKSNLTNYASLLRAAFPEKHISDLANTLSAARSSSS